MAKLGKLRLSALKKELRFSTSRSGGPGGQHVNKVNTKVILKFSISGSLVLSGDEKKILTKKLGRKITSEGALLVVSQGERSQLRNKELAIKKFSELLEKSLKKPKPRKPTKPTKASVEKRLQQKKKSGEKKKLRGRFQP